MELVPRPHARPATAHSKRRHIIPGGEIRPYKVKVGSEAGTAPPGDYGALKSMGDVSLPFDLAKDASALQNEENRAMITALFPGNDGMATDGSFLYLRQNELPPHPRPKRVAGLPIYCTMEETFQHSPVPNGQPVRRANGTIADDLDGSRSGDFPVLFERIRKHFESRGIKHLVVEVMHWGTHLLFVISDKEAAVDNFPFKAGGLPCLYLYQEDMGYPDAGMMQARRDNNDPSPTKADDTEYVVLRPGIRVSSPFLRNRPGQYLSTTAGVLVADGARPFMTVASHGFPEGRGSLVFHPDPESGRAVGTIVAEIPFANVSLVELYPGEIFENETFETDGLGPIGLRSFLSVTECPPGTPLLLDSPETGLLEGTIRVPAFRQIPTDDPEIPALPWAFTSWSYMGQDSGANLPAGLYGTPLWTGKGDVVGFFRYAPVSGAMTDWCCSTASDMLKKTGYSLVNTSAKEDPVQG